MRAGRTRPRGTPAIKTDEISEGYLNSRPEAERIIRENCTRLLRNGTPRSVVLDYLRAAGGDLSILADAPSPEEAQGE